MCFLPGAPGCSADCASEFFRGASLIVDSCLWYRVGFRLALLRRLKWGAGMLACVASIFALIVMILRAEDAFGNGFEVFDCYEIGSVFAF